MELKLGIMKDKELAEWFGVTASQFSKTKEKKLDILKYYCKFEMIGKKVNILEIYEPEFKDELNKVRYIYEKAFEEEWDKSGLDTSTNVNMKIYDKYQDQLTSLKGVETGYHYALETRNKLYGRPFVDFGEHGTCIYTWCKVNKGSEEQPLVEFTEEEQRIKKELMEQYFATDEEREILIAEMVEGGELSEAEGYRLITAYKNLNKKGFLAFKNALENALGYKVVRATKLIKDGNVMYQQEQEMLGEGFENW